MSAREDVVFPPVDEPLRADVHLLGALVGDVIREQGGAELFERVEMARQVAIRRRAGDPDAAGALGRATEHLGPALAASLVRAFSTYFRVVNRAEQVHRLRRRREYDRHPETPPPGSMWDALATLRAAGVGAAAARALVAGLRIEPVFTAHPTEATRQTLLEKEQRIAARLLDRLDPSRTPVEEAALVERIRMEITLAWLTEAHPSARPSVADEREHVLFYLTRVLYSVVPAFHESIEDAFTRVWGEPLGDVEPLVRFASWVGGDMDGNPSVSATTVRETLACHRELALACHRAELDHLARALSQSASHVAFEPEIEDRIAAASRVLPAVLPEIPERHRTMRYRVLCRLMAARLDAARTGGAGRYAGPGELIDDLRAIARSIEAHGGRYAGLFLVRRALQRVRTFGFHLAALDVRQDARVHRQVVGRMLGDAAWEGRAPSERAGRLSRALAEPAVTASAADEDGARTRAVFRALAEGLEVHGTDAIGPFIISMARDVDDVLSVLYLARQAGLIGPDGAVPLDVAPLFETVDDLRAAGDTLRALFANDVYRAHLETRGRAQMVMVGYSDSSKDGGLVASRWALQRAQTAMVAACAAAQIRLTVFHGRGGTVGRGGGKTHRAVLAAPAGSVEGRLRMTEQGEVIDAKYGMRGIALRTLERAAGAVALVTAMPRSRDRRETGWHAVMDELAAASRAAYRSLVHEHPRFTEYFRAATPIDVIERMAIGSRPPSRGGGGIDALRAIPWVFAWTQSRHLLPAWFGLGSGLEHVLERYSTDAVREMARDFPPMATLLEDAEMALAKTDLPIAQRYAALAGDARDAVFPRIASEFESTVARVLDLRGGSQLLERDPVLRRLILLRNPYVDPMSFLQVDLLAAWRASGRRDADLFAALLETVNGIAQGLQNTG